MTRSPEHSSSDAPVASRARRGLPAVRAAMVLAFLLHAGAVLWIWRSWEAGLRGSWLVWIDFPVSLLYLGARSSLLLTLSLTLGSAWWAGIGGTLSWLLGRMVKGAP